MRNETIRFALNKIEIEWVRLSADYQPWGVWIRQHVSIPNSVIDRLESQAALQRVWFLSREGITPRDPWDYLRMMVVQFEQPWCKKMWKERTTWSANGPHEIGFAGFAEYENSEDIYVEVIWGGLFGRGWRITIGEQATETGSRLLWVS